MQDTQINEKTLLSNLDNTENHYCQF